jgi:hypothetical protein
MRLGSLFSGCQGLDLGLEAVGFNTVWACESDEHCRRVIGHHRPNLPVFEDIRTLPMLKKLTADQVEEAVRLYDEGASCGQLAERYGVTRQGMWDLLRRRTTMRPRERYAEENHFHRGGSKASDKAQNLLEQALEGGKILRPDVCEQCGKQPKPFKDGRTAIQGHHDDYNKPLDVRWLCQPCHHEWHRQHQPIEEVRSEEVPDVDVLAGGFP